MAGKTGIEALVDASVVFRQTERMLQLKLEKQCIELATWAAMEMPGLMPVGPANSELRTLRRSVNETIRPILDDLRRLREGREQKL